MDNEQFEFDLDQILSEFTAGADVEEAPPAESRRVVPDEPTRVNLVQEDIREETTVFTPAKTRPAADSRRKPVSRSKSSSDSRKEKPVARQAPKKEPDRPRPVQIKEQPAKKKEKRPRKTFADVMPRWLISATGLLVTLVLLLFILCCVTPAGSQPSYRSAA